MFESFTVGPDGLTAGGDHAAWGHGPGGDSWSTVSPVSLSAENVRAFSTALADADLSETADPQLIDLMRVLEELKSAAAAVQARAAAAFDASQRRTQSRAGVPAEHLGRGVGSQVALARRDSPHRGSRHLGLGKALVHEMPYTLAALSSGVLSEWRATLLVRETACLDVEDRRRVDELICKDPASLEGLGDRKLIARIRTITQTIDPASQVRRNAKAVSDRYVSCRPAPDTMSYLTGLLPVAQGVAVYAALSRAADSLRASGDGRGRGQIMADTLVERVTGQDTADQVPVEVQLVITDRTLLSDVLFPQRQTGGDRVPGAPETKADTPAYFPGYGTIPGAWARNLISSALGTGEGRHASPPGIRLQGSPPGTSRQASPPGTRLPSQPLRDTLGVPDKEQAGGDTPAGAGLKHKRALVPVLVTVPEPSSLVSLRRLYLDPFNGELTAMESKARAFPAGLARMIRTRDRTCRTPWCDAPIRHIDHIRPRAEGGPTSYTNGQGLCEACNHAKEAPGWNATTIRSMRTARTGSGRRHTVRITTPTGHTYTSAAPPLPGGRAHPAMQDL
ncbi:HNH endonuclease [Arthrobacter sp. zg-Y916]|uniref:HNH endonuclease n=1 Tax=Arthrobacter sp. zg-Y916 TaxID=2894190 RepID=UPI001E44980B|nr:HNH endonuclease signature motif containing protein [Arthrobacter sp. zg-Y916]MCC9193275.1 HNH endonuclease [Arthrobacter sp. zg-Y916]